MNDKQADRQSRPWYKQAWPWLVMLPPAAAVVAGIATVIIANTGADSLVVDDFQKVGLVANRVTERDRVAEQLGIGASIAIDHGNGAVTVRLVGEKRPASLWLSLHHPTRPELDRRAQLQRDETRLYRGNIGALEEHRWYLQLIDGDGEWRLSGELAQGQRLFEFLPPSMRED